MKLKEFLAQYDDYVQWKITKIAGNTGYPIGYWAIGMVITATEDHPFKMTRLANSEHPDGHLGIFTTSTVIKVKRGKDYDIITTNNSTYKLEQLNSVMSVISKKMRAEGFSED